MVKGGQPLVRANVRQAILEKQTYLTTLIGSQIERENGGVDIAGDSENPTLELARRPIASRALADSNEDVLGKVVRFVSRSDHSHEECVDGAFPALDKNAKRFGIPPRAAGEEFIVAGFWANGIHFDDQTRELKRTCGVSPSFSPHRRPNHNWKTT